MTKLKTLEQEFEDNHYKYLQINKDNISALLQQHDVQPDVLDYDGGTSHIRSVDTDGTEEARQELLAYQAHLLRKMEAMSLASMAGKRRPNGNNDEDFDDIGVMHLEYQSHLHRINSFIADQHR